jgi:hypothetical protein
MPVDVAKEKFKAQNNAVLLLEKALKKLQPSPVIF